MFDYSRIGMTIIFQIKPKTNKNVSRETFKKHMFTNMISQLINLFDYVSLLNRFTPLGIK